MITVSIALLKGLVYRDPDFAFLIVRALRKSIPLLPLYPFAADILTAISGHPPDFEWDQYEPLLEAGVQTLALAKHSCLTSVYMWLIEYDAHYDL